MIATKRSTAIFRRGAVAYHRSKGVQTLKAVISLTVPTLFFVYKTELWGRVRKIKKMENSTKQSLSELIENLISSNHLINPTFTHILDKTRLIRVVKCLIDNFDIIDESDIKQICEEILPDEEKYLLDNPDKFIQPILEHIRDMKKNIDIYLSEVKLA